MVNSKKYKIEWIEEQAGFKVEKYTVDHLFTITQILRRKTAFDQEVYTLYVDLKMACDNVPSGEIVGDTTTQ